MARPTERRLPGRLRTACTLLAVDAGLRLLGFARMRSLLTPRSREVAPSGASPDTPSGAAAGTETGPAPGAAHGELTDRERTLAQSLAHRVERAAGFRVYRVPCLPRALLVERWLGLRGLPAELRIGARRQGGAFGAHAWVACGDLVLDPDPGVEERFPPLRG